MKVLAITGNYNNSATSVVEEPLGAYLIADSSIIKSNRPVFLPEFATSVTAHPSLAIHVGRLGKCISKRFASRYANAVASCFTLTAQCMGQGLQGSAMATAFDGALLLGEMTPIAPALLETSNYQVTAAVNSAQAATFDATRLVMGIEDIIAWASQYFTLKMGDIIVAGTAKPSIAIKPGMQLTATLNGTSNALFRIK